MPQVHGPAKCILLAWQLPDIASVGTAQVTNQSSEVADDRPSAACEFAPSGATLATGAWSGLVKLWSVPACQKQLTIKAHEDRVTGKARAAVQGIRMYLGLLRTCATLY